MRRVLIGMMAALAVTGTAAADPAGKTTVDETIQRAPGSGFVGLQSGPGERHLLRQGTFGRTTSARARKRRSMIFFAQFSDTHIIDESSPARVDFVDPAGEPLNSSWRPNEAFTTQVFDQMVRNVNANRTSDVRGRGGKRATLGFAITTGDNVDNQQLNEGQWFAGVLSGGTVDPFSGKTIGPGNPCSADEETTARLNADVAARRHTGLQDYDDYPNAPADRYDGFWDPDQAPPNAASPYAAFPRYPGLMDRAQTPFTAEGLSVPYFIARGNHDGEIQGNIPATFALARGLITGCNKILPGANFDPKSVEGATEEELIEKFADPQFQQQLLSQLRPAPPDPDRRFISAKGFRDLFTTAPARAGYRYVSSAENRASKGAANYYAWSPKKNFRFISLDTVAEGGGQTGNVDNAQYKWLKRELDRASKTEIRGKRLVRDSGRNQLIVVYGHHALDDMNNTASDEKAGKCASDADEPGCDRDPRRSTPLHRGTRGKNNIRSLLLSYPNVVAFVNGHKHKNRIKSFKQRRFKTGFWEINTAAHVDWPEQARLIDIFDNRDGTLSIFNTMVDSAAPIVPPTPGSVAATFNEAQLASISRVLSANDPQDDENRRGRHADRNTELVIRDPRSIRR